MHRFLRGGLFHKWFNQMSSSRKRRHVKRLKRQDSVVQSILDTGLSFKALDKVASEPRCNEMSWTMKYQVFSKKHPRYVKSVGLVPHYTKVVQPRTMPKIVVQK